MQMWIFQNKVMTKVHKVFLYDLELDAKAHCNLLASGVINAQVIQ